MPLSLEYMLRMNVQLSREESIVGQVDPERMRNYATSLEFQPRVSANSEKTLYDTYYLPQYESLVVNIPRNSYQVKRMTDVMAFLETMAKAESKVRKKEITQLQALYRIMDITKERLLYMNLEIDKDEVSLKLVKPEDMIRYAEDQKFEPYTPELPTAPDMPSHFYLRELSGPKPQKILVWVPLRNSPDYSSGVLKFIKSMQSLEEMLTGRRPGPLKVLDALIT